MHVPTSRPTRARADRATESLSTAWFWPPCRPEEGRRGRLFLTNRDYFLKCVTNTVQQPSTNVQVVYCHRYWFLLFEVCDGAFPRTSRGHPFWCTKNSSWFFFLWENPLVDPENIVAGKRIFLISEHRRASMTSGCLTLSKKNTLTFDSLYEKVTLSWNAVFSCKKLCSVYEVPRDAFKGGDKRFVKK